MPIKVDNIGERIEVSPPTNPTDSCIPGQIAYQDGYFFVCIAANTWQRVAIATWTAATAPMIGGAPYGLLLAITIPEDGGG